MNGFYIKRKEVAINLVIDNLKKTNLYYKQEPVLIN